MGQQIPIRSSAVIAGQEVILETGKLAALADGSVMLRFGNTMLLATAVAAEKANENQDFFPLTVEYREKFAAGGRIPGNRELWAGSNDDRTRTLGHVDVVDRRSNVPLRSTFADLEVWNFGGRSRNDQPAVFNKIQQSVHGLLS